MYCGEGLVDFGRGDRERGGEYPAAVVFYVEGGLAVVRDELAGDGGEDVAWWNMAEAGAEPERVLLVGWDQGGVDFVPREHEHAVSCHGCVFVGCLLLEITEFLVQPRVGCDALCAQPLSGVAGIGVLRSNVLFELARIVRSKAEDYWEVSIRGIY